MVRCVYAFYIQFYRMPDGILQIKPLIQIQALHVNNSSFIGAAKAFIIRLKTLLLRFNGAHS